MQVQASLVQAAGLTQVHKSKLACAGAFKDLGLGPTHCLQAAHFWGGVPFLTSGSVQRQEAMPLQIGFIQIHEHLAEVYSWREASQWLKSAQPHGVVTRFTGAWLIISVSC